MNHGSVWVMLEWTMLDALKLAEMKAEERVAYKHLVHRGFKSISYEPEGKSKLPDFLVDCRIAVEVRRLNQNEVFSKPRGARGLEEAAIPVRDRIRRLLPSFGPPTGPVSWYVVIRFSRPVPRWKTLKSAVSQHLQGFRDNPRENPTTLRRFDNFILKLYPADRPHGSYFVMAGGRDCDSGGWVTSELGRNLKICIDEKTATVAAIRTKYPEWWLVLIDRINFGREEAIEVPPHNWDKIILVNPLDHTQAFEVR